MADLKSIEITMTVTRRDVFRSGLLVFRQNYKWRYLISITIAALIGIFFAAMHLIGAPPNQRFELYSFDVVIGLPILVYFFPHLVIGGVARSLYNNNRHMSEPTRILFSPSGVTTESSVLHTDVKWTVYDRILETRDYFLLYTSPKIAGGLPKRCFSSDADLRAFRDLVRSKLGEKADLR